MMFAGCWHHAQVKFTERGPVLAVDPEGPGEDFEDEIDGDNIFHFIFKEPHMLNMGREARHWHSS